MGMEIFSLLLAPILTCILEVPIIRAFRIVRDNKYIIAVNVLTNLILNVVSMLLQDDAAWILFMELLAIPLSEAFLYKQISKKGWKQIIPVSYLANAVSWGIGYVIFYFLT